MVSHFDPPSEPPEKADTEKEPESAEENCSQDKKDDHDNPLTSHFKMIFKGLTRSKSQESLASTKNAGDEDPQDSESSPHCSQNGGLQGESTEGPSWRHFNSRSNKKEKLTSKLSCGANKAKGKDHGALQRGEDSQGQKSHVSWEQQEATKAIFDLLKEISGVFSTTTTNRVHLTANTFKSHCSLLAELKSRQPHVQTHAVLEIYTALM